MNTRCNDNIRGYEFDNCDHMKNQCDYNLKCNGPIKRKDDETTNGYMCTSWDTCKEKGIWTPMIGNHANTVFNLAGSNCTNSKWYGQIADTC